MCTPEGLPLSFEVFAGNRAAVTTVDPIVRAMEVRIGVRMGEGHQVSVSAVVREAVA